MGIFNKLRTDGMTHDGQGEERRGMIDRITYNGEENDLVWKFPYDNISTGAQLIVNGSQEAIFFKGGAALDVFGPGQHTLSANNIPLLQKLVNLPFGGRTPFVAEVWYVDKKPHTGILYGTPAPVPLFDPYYNVTVPVRCNGSFGIRIVDSSVFINQMVGTRHLVSTENIEDFFFDLVVDRLSEILSRYVVEAQVSIGQLNARRSGVRDFMFDMLNKEVGKYGVELEQFNIVTIDFDKNSPEGKIIIEAQATDAAAAAERRRMQQLGYTYQQERQFDVMEKAAGNEGSAGTMMGAGMGLGMGLGVGNVMGAQMGQIGGVMNAQGMVPPPPPTIQAMYYVLVNNLQQGPYALPQLQQMVQQGILLPATLVWKQGMPQWQAASTCPELAGLFGMTPPPPPPPVVP